MKIFNCKIYDDNADLIGVTDFDLIYIEDENKSNISEFIKLNLRVKFEYRAIFKPIEKNIYLTIRAMEGKKIILRLTKTNKTKKGLNGRVSYIKIYDNESVIFEYDRFNFILKKYNQNMLFN